MCTYQTATLPISGSGKGAGGWFPLTFDWNLVNSTPTLEICPDCNSRRPNSHRRDVGGIPEAKNSLPRPGLMFKSSRSRPQCFLTHPSNQTSELVKKLGVVSPVSFISLLDFDSMSHISPKMFLEWNSAMLSNATHSLELTFSIELSCLGEGVAFANCVTH